MRKAKAICYAVLAAVLYSLMTPVAKLILSIALVIMAAGVYLNVRDILDIS